MSSPSPEHRLTRPSYSCKSNYDRYEMDKALEMAGRYCVLSFLLLRFPLLVLGLGLLVDKNGFVDWVQHLRGTDVFRGRHVVPSSKSDLLDFSRRKRWRKAGTVIGGVRN